jgi:glycosyltransferase involved in cell wall biosynthesis
MKLLVLAQTPPPLHGQSAMVQTLLDALREDPHFEVHHVNLRLSQDTADIGRWRPGKLVVLLGAVVRAIWIRCRTRGPIALYYVPAPGKRGALYRDWLALGCCRPFFSRLILHWHSAGLGEWLRQRATLIERWLTRLMLGRADLALVLAPELVADAAVLAPRRIRVVANGIPSPPVPAERAHHAPPAPYAVLFLGLCSREKGVFDALAAVRTANARESGAFRLVVAGAFPNDETRLTFLAAAESMGAAVHYAGFADATQKAGLLDAADVLCFPTAYPHEAQPLVLLEALAHDLPIIATRWRAIPGMLPDAFTWLVDRGHPEQIADALFRARAAGRAQGMLRAYFLSRFTLDAHKRAIGETLREP